VVEPVPLGKLLAQVLVAAAVIAAGALLLPVFSFRPTLAALSLVIWGKPFYVWLVDGYFGTTPALTFQLVLTAWLLSWVAARARGVPRTDRDRRRGVAIAGLLSLFAAFSEWIAVLATPITIPAFLVAGVAAERRGLWRSDALAIAASMVAGTGLAVAATVSLFVSKVGWRVYWAGLNERVYVRSGEATSLIAHSGVVFRQMQTGWPFGLIVALLAAFAVDVDALVALSSAAYRRLATSDGLMVDAMKRDHADIVQAIVERWRQVAPGNRETVDPRFRRATILGVLGSQGRWYVLVDNLDGDALPDLHDGINVLLSDVQTPMTVGYAVRSRDGRSLLPFSVIELEVDPRRHAAQLRLERAGLQHAPVADQSRQRARRQGRRRELNARSPAASSARGAQRCAPASADRARCARPARRARPDRRAPGTSCAAGG